MFIGRVYNSNLSHQDDKNICIKEFLWKQHGVWKDRVKQWEKTTSWEVKMAMKAMMGMEKKNAERGAGQ